jgi:hypothetical protein
MRAPRSSSEVIALTARYARLDPPVAPENYVGSGSSVICVDICRLRSASCRRGLVMISWLNRLLA